MIEHAATEPSPWYDDVPFPALLRAARASYGAAIRRALAEAGCDDLPPNGTYVIGAMARVGASMPEIIHDLGIAKTTAEHLIDTLVARDFLYRQIDPTDAARRTFALTGRGQATAEVIRQAVEGLDAQVLERVGAEAVARARATLAALIHANPNRVPEPE